MIDLSKEFILPHTSVLNFRHKLITNQRKTGWDDPKYTVHCDQYKPEIIAIGHPYSIFFPLMSSALLSVMFRLHCHTPVFVFNLEEEACYWHSWLVIPQKTTFTVSFLYGFKVVAHRIIQYYLHISQRINFTYSHFSSTKVTA